jgi:putative peptidoglycan lipid II flippase
VSDLGSARHYLFKNASIVAVLSATGVASGLVLDSLILGLFGMGHSMDALSAALTIPLIIGNILRVQVPKLLIPAFAEHHEDASSACELLSNLITTGFFVLVGIALVGAGLSGMIIPLQVPGLTSDVIALSVWLSRMLFALVVLQGLGSILQSVLFARHSYLVSSSGKLVANIVTITVVILWTDSFGIRAVAGGMLLAEFVQVALLAWALSAQGFHYRWVVKPTDPTLLAIFRAFRYPLTGHVLAESATILQNVLGSFLGPGRITLIRYATRIIQSIAGLLLGSISQVTFPLISQHAADNDVRALRKTLLESVRLLCIVGLPISIWLIFAAEPMLVLLFVRGEFSRGDAALTSIIVGLMVPCILLSRIITVAQAPFYADMDVRPPLVSMLVFSVVHVVLATTLVAVMGLFGLPIALSLASLCGTGYMVYKLQRRFGPLGWSELRGFACRLSAASALAGVGFVLGTRSIGMLTLPGAMAKLVDFAVPTSFAVCAFVVGAFLFGVIDARVLMQWGWARALFSSQSS